MSPVPEPYDDEVTEEQLRAIRELVEAEFGPINEAEWEIISGPAW